MQASIQEKILSGDFFKVVCVGDVQTLQPYTAPRWTDWIFRALRENGDQTKTWRRHAVNMGTSKATLQHISTFYSHYIGSCKPDLLILSFGVASIFPHFSEQEYLEGLDALLEKVTKENLPFALWSPYPLAGGQGKEELIQIGRILQRKAESYGGLYVDIAHAFEGVSLGQLFTQYASEDDAVFGLKKGSLDHIHVNTVGNYIIAKEISEKVLGLSLPKESAGSYEVPNIGAIKSW